MVPGGRLFLIDSFGFIFRAYHARARSGAPPMRTSSGVSTEAVLIFHNMLRKLMEEARPEYLVAVFESEAPTLREQEFAEYKANRQETPPDLLEQIPLVRRLLEALRIPVLEASGYEADDVIGTLARRAAAAGLEAVIVSSDKDMLQLVGEGVSMVNPAKDYTWYDAAKVEEFMGVPPGRVADLLALKGDAVDNIPGAPGIGDKGARDLIARFGSVEEALARAAEVERKAYRESLQNHREQIELSKRLATIDTAAPVEFDFDAARVADPDAARLRELFKELEFHSLLKQLTPEPAPEPAGRDWRTLESAAEVRAWVEALPPGCPLAVSVVAGGGGELEFPASIGLAARPGEARAIAADLLEEIQPLIEDAGRRKAVHDAKAARLEFERLGVAPRGLAGDVMLYGFLLTADPAGCGLEAMTTRLLDRAPGTDAAARAAAVFDLERKLAPEVDARGFRELYETIDLPFTAVLARMERTGIRIEPECMRKLSASMEEEIGRLTGEIHALAGHAFNINSPQQLGRLLFEEMGLAPPNRRGAGKNVSTAADVLETLAAEHPIAGKVLEYRQLAKLKGTYVDALPSLIRPATGRLHTTFNQAGAATGRLSSSNPNLQNIPIRSELGRQIRSAFVPREGWTMLVADYSQIELRLLAHLSGDAVLVEAFRNGEDIHTRTAAEVFGVPPLMVTPEQRRNAKAVNFGIVYGQTAFGLAAQTGVDRAEAEAYIRGYFARYAGVKKFIDATIAECRKTEVSRTMFGRERPIPDINSRNPNARGFAERTAVNTPLQGAAADLIKLAMIRIDGLLASERLESRMLLQVHDELVFEGPPGEMAALTRLVKTSMEGVRRLEVPLLVDIGSGPNWRDAK